MLYLLLPILFFFPLSQAATSTTANVLFLKEGVATYGQVDKKQLDDVSKENLTVSSQRQLSYANNSQSTQIIPRNNITAAVNEIRSSFQGNEHTLREGTIVLGKDKKPYLIHAVFPDGRIVWYPLEINLNSRYRLEQNNYFAPIRNQNTQIVTTADILAVEQRCFLTYCRGDQVREIAGVPVCEAAALRDRTANSLGVPCGRTAQNGAAVNAAFSDGTLLLRLRLVNPFPESTWRYAPSNTEAPSAPQ